MKRPDIALAVYINGAVRGPDEQFDEPDELDRVARALAAIDSEDDVLVAAGMLAYAVTRAQGFAEGNKRTALLLARWLLDENGMDGVTLLPVDDRQLADLLVKAAAGADVQAEIVELLTRRT